MSAADVWSTPDWEIDILIAGIAGETGLECGEGWRLYPTGAGPGGRRRRTTDIPMGGDMEHPAWKDLPQN